MAGGADRQAVTKLIGDDTSWKQTLSSAESATGKSGGVMKGIFAGVGIGMVNLAEDAGGKVIGFLSDSVTAANEAQTATAKLTQAMKDAGQKYSDSASSIESFTKAQEQLGFTNTDTTNSLAAFVTGGDTVQKAMQDMAAAQDLARLKGISLADATTTIVKAEHGRTVGLTSMGIQIAKGSTSTQILADIEKAAGGQAAAYAGTMSGQLAVASSEVNDAQEQLGSTMNDIGATVMPIVTQALLGFTTWLTGAMPTIKAIVSQIVTDLQPAFQYTAALLQTVVIPAIQSLAGFIQDPLLPIFNKLIGFIQNNVAPWLSSIAKTIIPPITAAFKTLSAFIADPVVPILSKVATVVVPLLGAAFLAIGPIIQTVASIASGVADVIGRVFGVIGAVIKGVINGVISAVNFVIGAIDAIQVHIHVGPVDLDWNGLNLGKLPYMHTGGIVPGAPGADVLTMLQAGERVLPRSQAGGGPNITININGGYVDGPTIDRITNELTRRLRFAPGT